MFCIENLTPLPLLDGLKESNLRRRYPPELVLLQINIYSLERATPLLLSRKFHHPITRKHIGRTNQLSPLPLLSLRNEPQRRNLHETYPSQKHHHHCFHPPQHQKAYV